MKTISYHRPRPTLQLIYGVGLLVLNILALISGNLLGVLFGAAGFYFFRKEGLEMDLENSQYRTTTSLFNLTFGTWHPLPEIEYVSVFKTTQTSRVWVSAASTQVTTSCIKVNLFYNTNRKIEAYETDNTDQAFAIATQIASALHLKVLDATSRDPKWL
ncbi:hypothetical protein [Winogradskyella rapida]|uniref:Uncharacterized protein n=1 Tax=Winogradskyella rapida TaxID=549701 RepID=A0ABW3KVC1_9FLAO